MQMIKVITAVFLSLAAFPAFAWEEEAQSADSVVVRYRDSLVYIPVPQVTEYLLGSTVYQQIGPGFTVSESESVRAMVDSQTVYNSTALQDCYRIRIFFDNKQNSREASLATEERFKSEFPGFSTYRTFKSPFFKVTIGDFRAKADAQALLRRMGDSFPSAFIVKESCKFPTVDYESMFVVDTLKVPVDTVSISL